jgi:hypothetical protein
MIDAKLIDAVGTFKLDLELQLHEQADGGVIGQLIYDRDLFDPSTAGGIARHLTTICASVAVDPIVRLAAIPRPGTENSGSSVH